MCGMWGKCDLMQVGFVVLVRICVLFVDMFVLRLSLCSLMFLLLNVSLMLCMCMWLMFEMLVMVVVFDVVVWLQIELCRLFWNMLVCMMLMFMLCLVVKFQLIVFLGCRFGLLLMIVLFEIVFWNSLLIVGNCVLVVNDSWKCQIFVVFYCNVIFGDSVFVFWFVQLSVFFVLLSVLLYVFQCLQCSLSVVSQFGVKCYVFCLNSVCVCVLL